MNCPPSTRPISIGRWIALALLIVLAITGYRIVFGRPSFDPEALASAETKMWKAYYSGDRTSLGLQLIAILRRQHGLSLLEAKTIGNLLADASAKFQTAQDNYEAAALPQLIQAYALIRKASHAKFDPEEAARAELAWWVARRTPGHNSAEEVGEGIAVLYAKLYGGDKPCFHLAGQLRAQAATIRDEGGEEADWKRVRDYLRQSYSALKQGL